MIAHLYLYFGIAGIASIIAWLGALALAANYLFHERRTFFFARAVTLSMIGVLLAQINSANVSRIEVDHRQELQAARERQLQSREAQMDTLQKRTANIRFAEDNATDALDLAGNPSAVKRSAYEKAADEKSGDKQREQTGRKRWKPVGDSTPATPATAADRSLAAPSSPGEPAEEDRPAVRLLPQRDVDRADQLDILNLWASRGVLFIALLAFCLNYLGRFHRTAGVLLPLPLSGRWLNSLLPRKHSVVFRSGNPALARSYMETAVRKGECFVYCGETNLPLAPAIARVHLPVNALSRYFFEVIRPYFLQRMASWLGRLPVAGQPLSARLRRLACALGRGSRSLGRGLVQPFRWICKQLSAMHRLRRGIKAAGRFCEPLLRKITAEGNEKLQSLRPLLPTWRNGVIEWWPARVITVTADPQLVSHNFICECAWFNRYCFAVEGLDRSLAVMAAFCRFLDNRIQPRATSATTLHLLWDFREPLPPDLVRPLAVFSKEVNAKLIVFAGDSQIAEVGKWMEEVCPDEAPPIRRPTLASLLAAWIQRNTGRLRADLQPWWLEQRENIKQRQDRVMARRAAKAAAAAAAAQPAGNKAAAPAVAARPPTSAPGKPEPLPKVQPVQPESMPAPKPPPGAPASQPRVSASTLQPEACPALKPKPVVQQAHGKLAPKIKAVLPPAEAQAAPLQPAEVNQAAGVLKFYCPACRQKLSAQTDWQGKMIVCPACKASITIPAL